LKENSWGSNEKSGEEDRNYEEGSKNKPGESQKKVEEEILSPASY